MLHSVLFAAADFLSALLLVKFMRDVPILGMLPNFEENHNDFSPALSLITEIDHSSDNSDGFNAHLERQHDLEQAEQNAQDCEAFNDFISGYNGQFWEELDCSP